MLMNRLPIVIEPHVMNNFYPNVFYPQATSMRNEPLQYWLNQEFFELAARLIRRQFSEQQTNSFTEMIGKYAVKTNEKDIISVTCSNYAIFYQAAHGLTLMNSATIDLQTGQIYSLSDLFEDNQQYINILSIMIRQQIKERDIPTFEPFTEIAPNQSYYLSDKCLIIYYPLYEITPYYYGFPYFPISLYTIAPLLKENSFIQRLIENN